MTGAFKGLSQADIQLTSYISKKRWQIASENFENLGICKIEAASGSSTYGSFRISYYEGSIPNSGSFSGSYDLDLQSTITLQGGRRLPETIVAYSIPRDCFGENIEEGSVTLSGQTCTIRDREGLLLLDPERSLPFGFGAISLDPGTVEEDIPVALGVQQLETIVDQQYELEILVPENGTWEGLEDQQCLFISGAYLEDPSVEESFTGSQLSEMVGSPLTIRFLAKQPRVEITWIEHDVRAGQEGPTLSLMKLEGSKVEVMGDIIYNKGLILLNGDKANISLEDLLWTSKVTINTWNIRCPVKDLEYNYSYNPSVVNPNKGLMGTSEFTPYITAVGLYNRAGELMAVAKLSKPIRKNDNIDMTFRINLDV